MDTLQALVGNRLMGQVAAITEKRIANALYYDSAFAGVPEIRIPTRHSGVKQVYHTYVLRVADRDRLHAHLMERGIESKVHYPLPLHLQKAAADLGYQAGDFPVCEADCAYILTLPVHQYLGKAELDYVIETILTFYGKR